MNRVLCLIALSLSALVCGCGEKAANQFAVSGSVTYLGQPLDQGSIQFEPAADQPTFSGAPIEAGKYLLPSENGLAPGVYRVRISSAAPVAAAPVAAPGESGPPAKDRIPAKYNAETTLQAEVKKDGENKFDFDLR